MNNNNTSNVKKNSMKDMIEILKLQQVPSEHMPKLDIIKRELKQDLLKGDIDWFAIFCFNCGKIAGVREERRKRRVICNE